jgi:two-component system, chemotaxis family, protein-glutamate methylesterase/glutaminase
MDLKATDPKHIIVIGASAGGLTALSELVSQFKQDWDAAYFIVLHLSRKGISDFLVHRLKQHTQLPCCLAVDGIPIQKGTIYIGAPNFHLLVKNGEVKQGHGPEENRYRPSIDVLFRSAAASYGSRVTGIVLTGFLDDGTSGMWAIKRCGGTTIVQDPNEAEYPDMPLSVLNRMQVDYCLQLSEIGSVLAELVNNKQVEEVAIPADVLAEAKIAEKVVTGIDTILRLGPPSAYTCPDCGGMLVQVEDGKAKRYRCHTGHCYSERDLEVKQSDNVESTLWVALRMMEERKNLLDKMQAQAKDRGFMHYVNSNREKAEVLQQHIEQLKEMLFDTQTNDEV